MCVTCVFEAQCGRVIDPNSLKATFKLWPEHLINYLNYLLDIKGVWTWLRRRCCAEPCFCYICPFVMAAAVSKCQACWYVSILLHIRSSNLLFCFRFSPWYLPSFPLDRVTLKWPVHVIQSAHLVSYNKELSVLALCFAVTEGLLHVSSLTLFLLASTVSQDFIKMEIVQINKWDVKNVKITHSRKYQTLYGNVIGVAPVDVSILFKYNPIARMNIL